MGLALSCTKNGYTLTVHVPGPGDRKLRCRLSFPEQDRHRQSTVELGMISRKHNAFLVSEPWLCELAAPVTRKTVGPSVAGEADFELAIPPWLTPFKGTWLEIVVVVLARLPDESLIRLIIEDASAPGEVIYRLLKLPVDRQINAPISPWFFGMFLAATLLLIFFGFWIPQPDLHKGAFASGIVTFALSFMAIPSFFRWYRLGALKLRAEIGGEGNQARLRVFGHGTRITGEGGAYLTAREFLYSDSSLSKFDPIASVKSPLRALSPGSFEAELPWPSPDMAPPSLCLSRAQTQQGILWEIQLELQSRRGGTASIELPLSVQAEDQNS